MLGFRDFLLFGLTVVTASCLRIDHEVFSGMDFSHGVLNRSLNFGNLIIGNGISNDTDGYWSGEQGMLN